MFTLSGKEFLEMGPNLIRDWTGWAATDFHVDRGRKTEVEGVWGQNDGRRLQRRVRAAAMPRQVFAVKRQCRSRNGTWLERVLAVCCGPSRGRGGSCRGSEGRKKLRNRECGSGDDVANQGEEGAHASDKTISLGFAPNKKQSGTAA